MTSHRDTKIVYTTTVLDNGVPIYRAYSVIDTNTGDVLFGPARWNECLKFKRKIKEKE